MPATRIGPFALEEKLAGASCTYRGIHVNQRIAVALKVFAAPFGTGREAKQAFAEEWEQLKGLRQENIVRCYGGGMDEMRGYLASELVPGESLAAVLKRRGRLAWEQVVEYALQIVAALEYAHENDVPHLALSPDKLLLTPDGIVKVADFRQRRSTQAAFGSPEGTTARKAAYMAPEQFDSDGIRNAKTDMYALGCVLYELLTGQPPFVAPHIEQLEQAQRHEQPERLNRLILECPIWLDSLVHQLLEKDPLRRPHTMAAVRLALTEARRKAAEGISVTEHLTGGISAIKTSATRREAEALLGRRSKPKKKARATDDTPIYERVWFLVVALLLIAAVAVWALWPASEEKLFRQAEALLASDEPGAARRARTDYLEPLLQRFPDGQYAAAAREHIERMDMELAEKRLRAKLKLGKPLETEGERLLAEAWQYQQFGDSLAALEKFRSLGDVLPEDEESRIYRNIARREVAALEKAGVTEDRKAFLQAQLDRAEQLAAAGDRSEAQKIWRSIVTLYRSNPELAEFVERSERLLSPPATDRGP